MKSLSLCRICKKTLQVSLQRNIYSANILSARQKRKMVNYTTREPGLQHRKELFADDGLPEVESGDDFIEEESIDIQNIDIAHDEDQRDKKDYRKMVKARMTYTKYFAPPRQPLMLTCNEIDCIKYLHQYDPLNWNVRALSESFPATTEIIKKILKSNYKLSPERAKKKDEAVYKNWELLAAGKLEADPKVIEHCKKFIDRREVLLEQIKNTKFYLPEIKEEPKYNNGEMSKILEHYEKRLQEFQKEKDCKILPEKSNLEKEKKTYLELLNEEVNRVMSKRISKKENDVLRKMVNTYAKELTFEELENKALKRAEKNKKIDLAEKAILELKFGTPQQYTAPVEKETEEIKFKKIPQKLLQKETSVKLVNENQEYKLNSFEDDLPDLQTPDERTRFTKETGVGKLLNEIQNQVELKAQKSANNDVIADTETINVDEKEHFDKQVEDIKNTPFWNNNLKSKDKAEFELQKKPLEAPSECKRITKAEVQIRDDYPMRIPIPKSKRCSGLTFRVKDCFYDDDGEFLYRVPGMIQEKSNS